MNLPIDKGGTTQIKGTPDTIEFKDVSFAYTSRPDELVLRNINLQIKKNQHIAIVGENGAGKSTLIKLLTGLYHPTNGQVLLDGRSLKDVDVSSWHRQLGVLQQDSIRYYFANVRDNVRYGNVSKKVDDADVEQALKTAEALDFVKDLPKQLDNYVDNWLEDGSGNKGVELSGGQWQRLALARNFFRDSPVVILDEPTSAIDALAEAKIFKRLFSTRNRTIIVISHRVTTIEKADIIYMLEDGQIVETGTHRELVARKGKYYKMFEAQLSIDESK